MKIHRNDQVINEIVPEIKDSSVVQEEKVDREVVNEKIVENQEL